MKKGIVLALLWVFCSGFYDGDISGFWKTVNEDTGKAQSIIAIYEYKGKQYGKIIGTYDKDGKIDDTIYAPVDRAPGVVGNPFYCGLDIIWNLHPKDDRYKGKICDPSNGKVYDAELWLRAKNLVVRGKLLMFGRNQVWIPFPEKEFTSHFKKPDIKKFVPVIPQAK